ncbi:MAG: hypothetical protein GC202_09185 [Alphaproteobacteria bacterium]|nr:hypothetical protein [Alphaproteobacteria bacterium]
MIQENLPQPRGHKPRIDWRYAAMLLAEGRSTVDVATILGCSRQHVWRMLRRSNALRARTSELRRRKAAEMSARLEGLADQAVEVIHQAIADGDKRMACWLAMRLRLFDAPAAEEVALHDSAGAEQLESEDILDGEPAPVEVARARAHIAATDAEATRAEDAIPVTSLSDQGDKQATVTRRNALSALHYAATKSRAQPIPPGVFADD